MLPQHNLAPIANGSRVAIVGGGVAGVFFSLWVLKYAAEKSIHPDITIFEPRDFANTGPKGCKGCAGILSTGLLAHLNELGLAVPEGIIQSKITQYVVHTPYTKISLSNPIKDREIHSIYRGGGPQVSHFENQIGFNYWLLKEAEQSGIRILSKRVSAIYLENEVRVGVEDRLEEFDLVVLANGINSGSIEIKGCNYVPASTKVMSQNELFLGRQRAEKLLENKAHVFLLPHTDIVFGTLVPKGDFVNVSVLSRGVRPLPVKDFLKQEMLRDFLTDNYQVACACNPRITTGIARNFFSDRFVAIGDAAVSRLYKDGIGSSLNAAREAARTVVFEGIAVKAFKQHYYQFCRHLHGGNQWGKLLIRLYGMTRNSRLLHLSQNRIMGDEQDNLRGARPYTKATWGMFSGSYDYREIAWMMLKPLSLAGVTAAIIQEGLKSLVRPKDIQKRQVYVGNRKVLILGSGFGGSYIFRHLLPSLNRNENVETTMISNENFFLFTPLLHEVAMGKIETRHVAFPIRRLNWKNRFKFIQEKVEKIDLRAKTVLTSQGRFGYDYLVIALGSITDTSALGPASDKVFTLKTLHDSMVIRNHIIEVFEQAVAETDVEKRKCLLTFIVCGAGYTGVQIVTELTDFVQNHLVKFYRAIDPSEIRIMLVESDQKILAGLHRKMSQYALRQLQKMGIELRLESKVTAIKDSRVEVNQNETIFAETVIWVAGVVANPVVANLEAQKDEEGRVFVDGFMEVPGFPGVYALGDCAHFADNVTGRAVPPRAHNAIRQAKVVAHNILAEIRGWEKKSYTYTNNGEAVSLGSSRAVARFYNFRFYGFLARLIWIGAYSFLVTGSYNRVRIITDWALSFIYGRDTTYLKLSK